ncbi:myb DNA-binding domain containing protein [Niveomyces insectorum RCEF 264]|uniref:Myb DNA-binding domain containing protein n=1 Tax=Niveomyces insectorum RCEF 264 TaxID=1081102 RepID=A0A167SGE6_9HYPO|nr:myb DNA-binding domain containing protein [Niveomyces insectorum RCEF 264]
MASLFGPSLLRLPSPATQLLEAWTSNHDTQLLLDELLDQSYLTELAAGSAATNGHNGDDAYDNVDESEKDLLRQRLAAFDNSMGVLNRVVTAIKALQRTSPSPSSLPLPLLPIVLTTALAGNPDTIHEAAVPTRAQLAAVHAELLATVFGADEDDVPWASLAAVHAIDTFTGLEHRRRRDLDAVADALGVRTLAQLYVARHRMDPVLDTLEPLLERNDDAQAHFRTVYLGTRICAICHHLQENVNTTFVMQLLNAFFPPYLLTYPVPCIRIDDDVRALREHVFLVLMDIQKRTNNHSRGTGYVIHAEALQQALLAQMGIEGGWSGAIQPAFAAYWVHMDAAQRAYTRVVGPSVSAAGGGRSSSSSTTTGRRGTNSSSSNGGSRGSISRNSTGLGHLKSILKGTTTGASTSASNHSASLSADASMDHSDLVLHPLVRELSGLDAQTLLRTGLAVPAGTAREGTHYHHQQRSSGSLSSSSAASSMSSPRTLLQLKADIRAAQRQRTNGDPQPISSPLASFSSSPPSPPLPPMAQPSATERMNKEDDVFVTTATTAPQNDKGKGKSIARENDEDEGKITSHQQSDGCLSNRPMAPTVRLVPSTPAARKKPQQDTTSERTKKLIRSGWKSTESLFTKFKAQDQEQPRPQPQPQPQEQPASFSEMHGCPGQRRPSKTVRFSDEGTRSSVDVADTAPAESVKTADGTPVDDPADPWRYARAYLLEKVRAEQAGRKCTLSPPPPEWFAAMRNTSINNSNHDDSRTSLAAPTGHGSGRSDGAPAPDQTPTTPRRLFRKWSSTTSTSTRPSTPSTGTGELHTPATGAPMATPRLGKLAFELPRSESRKQLDLNTSLFQRQSLLMAAKSQIEGDHQKQQQQQQQQQQQHQEEEAKKENQRQNVDNGAKPTGSVADTSPPPKRPTPSSTLNSLLSKHSGSPVSTRSLRGIASGQPPLSPAHSILRRQPHGHPTLRSFTQPAASIKAAFERSKSRNSSTSTTATTATTPGTTVTKERPVSVASEPTQATMVPLTIDMGGAGYFLGTAVAQQLGKHRLRKSDKACEAAREAAALDAAARSGLHRDRVAQPAQTTKTTEHPPHQQHIPFGGSGGGGIGAAARTDIASAGQLPPFTLSKAWSSLKRGTSKMLAARKSTVDLREAARRGHGRTLSTSSSSSNHAGRAASFDRARTFTLTGTASASAPPPPPPHGSTTKLTQEEMWDLLSIRPPLVATRARTGTAFSCQPRVQALPSSPSSTPPLQPRPSTEGNDSPTVVQQQAPTNTPADKDASRWLHQLGPASPPPDGPLPPVPPPLPRRVRPPMSAAERDAREAQARLKAGAILNGSRSLQRGDKNLETGENEEGEDDGDDSVSSSLLDALVAPPLRPNTRPASNEGRVSNTVASSPASQVADGRHGGWRGDGAALRKTEKTEESRRHQVDSATGHRGGGDGSTNMSDSSLDGESKKSFSTEAEEIRPFV